MQTIDPLSPRIAILGAGITGLTAAWQLRRAGLSAVVFEQSPRVGGAIHAVRAGDWLHELGPNSLFEGTPDVAAFIDEVGLGSRRLYASEAAKQRYIVRDGRLVAMPASPLGFATTKLFSLRAKLTLLGEPFRARAADAARHSDHASAANRDLGMSRREESVADFVVRRLGREFLDYAVNPFVAGVYAGDPTRLSVRQAFPKLHALEQEHGSLIRGALARRNATGGPKGRIFSFPNGLEELPAALARSLGDSVRLETKVTALRRTEDAWEIEWAGRDSSQREQFDAVVCALPADALASLSFEGLSGARRLDVLREIEHPPVASVFIGFKRSDVRHPLDGFGVLVPQVEHGLILGTLFSSTLFSGRAPDGYVALTSFVGGMREPELAGLDEHELVRVVHGELARLVGVTAPPAFAHVKRWPRAIPQYTLGYQRHKDAIADFESSAPGLFIGGNCRDGISLANCIASGRRLADAIIDHRSRTASATTVAIA